MAWAHANQISSCNGIVLARVIGWRSGTSKQQGCSRPVARSSEVVPMVLALRCADPTASAFKHDDIAPLALEWTVGHLTQAFAFTDNAEPTVHMQRDAGFVFREDLCHQSPVPSFFRCRDYAVQQGATHPPVPRPLGDINRYFSYTRINAARGCLAHTRPTEDTIQTFRNPGEAGGRWESGGETLPVVGYGAEGCVAGCEPFGIDSANGVRVRPCRNAQAYLGFRRARNATGSHAVTMTAIISSPSPTSA